MKYFLVLLSFIFLITLPSLLFNGCKKGDSFQGTPIPFEVPQGFPQPVYSFSNNPVTQEGFELGRKLFYEGRLSKDGFYPCASCHQQRAAFTTFEHDLSHGYNQSHTTRNAPGIANLAWFTEYYQDGGTRSLETISLAHITSPVEMGETMDGVVTKLRQDTLYKRMFRAAFGDERINSQRILNALSQFVVNMVSYNSKYDRMRKGTVAFSTQEQSGYILFMAHCITCHKEPLFTDFSYRNIGLPASFNQDYGRMKVTGNKADSLKFRVPSLRNVAATSFYTHDGRFPTLKNMITHYQAGVVQSPTLDPLLTNGITLTNTEVDALVAFLHTLTDSSYLVNPRFSQQ